jgi:uncharacterized protein with LGFP repeats
VSQIDDKYAQLAAAGVNLGAPLGPEGDAANGGRHRDYQGGTIYWNQTTGAHEVHFRRTPSD